MSHFDRAFEKYAPVSKAPQAVVAAATETASVHLEHADECPMCHSKMKSGMVSARDIPTFWCPTCRVATPAHNTMFAGF